MIEKTKWSNALPATHSAPQPGDFPIGSAQSRAAARALFEKRSKPTQPPVYTIDLSSVNIGRCQEIYRKVALRRCPIEDGMPYFAIIFPKDFRPGEKQAPVTNGEQKDEGVSDPIPRSPYDDILNDENLDEPRPERVFAVKEPRQPHVDSETRATISVRPERDASGRARRC